MLPFKLVYHDRYDLRLGPHVFPSQKFRLIRDGLVAKGIADPAEILSPEPATDEDVLRVHTPEWVEKLQERQAERRPSGCDWRFRVRRRRLRRSGWPRADRFWRRKHALAGRLWRRISAADSITRFRDTARASA